MDTYHVGVTGHGGFQVEADDAEAAIERINEALGAFDSGDFDEPVVDYVQNEATMDRWEQSEARERGVNG